jgi:hypothetical protein
MSNCNSLKTVKGKRRRVWNGEESCNGLQKASLVENKRGTIVSKTKHKSAKELYNQLDLHGPKGWMLACKEAQSDLGYWPVPIKRGTKFYNHAHEIWNQLKSDYLPFQQAYSPFVPPSSQKTPKKYASPVKRVEMWSNAPKASAVKSRPPRRMKSPKTRSPAYRPFVF